MTKMDLFIPILLFSLLLRLHIVHGGHDAPPTEYRHTLSDLSQEKTLHCTSLPATERLLCELEGAFDAQGRPTTTKKLEPPLQPLKSCKFRRHDVYGLYPYSTSPSPALNRVLEKYEAMHRRCREADSDANLNRVYTSSKKPTCQYLIWRQSRYGFGNRLLSLISSFLYAIMSARVLLIEYPNWDDLFCEPFSGSSIQLQAATRLNQYLGESYVRFRDAGCRPGGKSKNGPCNSTVVNFMLDHTTPERDYEAITCPMGFARLRETPFITVRRCNQYFVPGFYLNPVLSPLLDVLFPRRNAFHLLSRFLLAPSDGMWSLISSHLDVHASRRIGVQVREFRTRRYLSEYDANVVQCIKKKGGFLPKMFRKRRVRAGEYVGVYMATLIRRHLKEVNSSMRVLAEDTGEEFRLKFQRLDGREKHDFRHQAEAMVDMWVLSMSHVLVTSQESTFGYIASGLSGVHPYFIDKEPGKGCFMGLGVEPCFHAAPKNLSCVREEAPAFSLQDLVKESSKVMVCNDRESGWTVLSPH